MYVSDSGIYVRMCNHTNNNKLNLQYAVNIPVS